MWKLNCTSYERIKSIGSITIMDQKIKLCFITMGNMIDDENTDPYLSFDPNIIKIAHEFSKIRSN